MRTKLELTASNVMTVLNEYITAYVLEERKSVREAVLAGMAALLKEIEYVKPIVVNPGSPPLPLRVQFTDETFENLVQHYQKELENYSIQKEQGAQAVGGGVYAEVITDEDYAERMKRAGLVSS